MLGKRREKLAIIHLAKKECALNEEAYRALLFGASGVASASLVESEAQFESIMRAFERLGFSSTARRTRKSPYCSPGQMEYIKALWIAASREKSASALRAMVKRIGHVDDPRFLDKRGASAVILALRDMCWKVGKNPDELKAKAGNPRYAP